MSGLAFTVPGDPRGKGRPRATIRGGHAGLYTDAKTVTYENLVKVAAHSAMAGRPPLNEPVSMRVSVRMVPAESHSAKKRAAMLAGELFPTKLPDLDNVVKAVLDGCNKVVFRDDALVVRLTAQKTYAATAGVDVTILPIARAS
jgi:Holliday junction resolvase RusA-like endonuclease